MKVFKPPNSYPRLEEEYPHTPVVFLAGSIEMDTAEKWQDKLIGRFEGVNVVFLNPRRDNWNNSIPQTIENIDFLTQLNWEFYGLEESHMIFMYFSPNTKSPISLLELGLCAATKRMIVVCPKEFWRRGNVEFICMKYGISLYDTFNEGTDALERYLGVGYD